MNKGTPADSLRTAAKQASFCLRSLLPDDPDAQMTVRMLDAALATKPAETPAEESYFQKWRRVIEGHPTESAGKSPEAAGDERFQAVMERLESWSKAYPLDVFPKPDYKRTAEVLGAAGLTLDRISADCMRHVITKVWEMLEPFAETQRSSNANESDDETAWIASLQPGERASVQPPAPEPDYWPSAKVTVHEDEVRFGVNRVTAELYAPGLPPGVYDLYLPATPSIAQRGAALTDVADARRYRWLTACKRVPWGQFLNNAHEVGIDAAIDAALALSPERPE